MLQILVKLSKKPIPYHQPLLFIWHWGGEGDDRIINVLIKKDKVTMLVLSYGCQLPTAIESV